MKDTKKGLKFMTATLFLITIGMLGFFLLGFAYSVQKSEEPLGGMLITFAGAGLLLTFLTFALMIKGVIHMKKGQDDMTEEHGESVSKGSGFMIAGIIMFIIFTIFLLLYGSSPVVGQNTPQETIAEIKAILFVLQISSILSTVFFSIGAIYLIIDIVSRRWTKLLWFAGGANILSVMGGFGSFLSIYLGDEFVLIAERLHTSHFLTQGLSFFGYALFAAIYTLVYFDVQNARDAKKNISKFKP
ncbi:MAG: hypothetical protein R6U17_04765 [Thermoplasmata archaeon]